MLRRRYSLTWTSAMMVLCDGIRAKLVSVLCSEPHRASLQRYYPTRQSHAHLPRPAGRPGMPGIGGPPAGPPPGNIIGRGKSAPGPPMPIIGICICICMGIAIPRGMPLPMPTPGCIIMGPGMAMYLPTGIPTPIPMPMAMAPPPIWPGTWPETCWGCGGCMCCCCCCCMRAAAAAARILCCCCWCCCWYMLAAGPIMPMPMPPWPPPPPMAMPGAPMPIPPAAPPPEMVMPWCTVFLESTLLSNSSLSWMLERKRVCKEGGEGRKEQCASDEKPLKSGVPASCRRGSLCLSHHGISAVDRHDRRGNFPQPVDALLLSSA